MAVVVVEAQAFAEGRLPPVCAVTGGPADTTMELRANPPVPWIVLVFGGFLALFLASSLQGRLDGEVPVAEEVYDRLAGRLAVGRVCLFAAGALVAVTLIGWRVAVTAADLLLRPWWAAAAGPVAVVAAVTAAWLLWVGLPRWWSGRRLVVRAVLRRDVRWVELRRVHAAFVRAVEAAERAARP